MIPRKQGGVLSVSNLRCSHGLFCTLQPAESVAKWAEKVGVDVEGEVVSKLREEIMWKKTREEKATEKFEGGEEGVGGLGWEWSLPKAEEHTLTASVGGKPLWCLEYVFGVISRFIIIYVNSYVTFKKESIVK